ncbi:MAG: gamma-glutamylcyclotransferase [Candidatus Lloydbacteria bacterium]|nr:gamma-glutamylcyclotransferase [Candidatus Lloydbacteria bacterium]
MDTKQLETRFGGLKNKKFSVIGSAILLNYAIKFNKRSSKDGSGKANIVPHRKSKVEGVIFDLTGKQFSELDTYEGGYHRDNMLISLGNQSIIIATVYVADTDALCDGLRPTKEYLNKILKGAKNFQLSRSYQKKLSKFNSHLRGGHHGNLDVKCQKKRLLKNPDCRG